LQVIPIQNKKNNVRSSKKKNGMAAPCFKEYQAGHSVFGNAPHIAKEK
jgi:hypothetical protein